MTIIQCDKCSGKDVERFEKKGKPIEPEVKTMTDFIKGSSNLICTPAIYHYTTWVLLCKDCGHRIEYTPGVVTVPLGTLSSWGALDVTH